MNVALRFPRKQHPVLFAVNTLALLYLAHWSNQFRPPGFLLYLFL
jgi:hypothetical protein